MLVWHVPALFNGALASDPLHIAQHLDFLVTGTIFWWPVFGPRRQLSTAPAVTYLFSGVQLRAACWAPRSPLVRWALTRSTFTPTLPLVRETWGIDARSDQQLAGMLMWVPGCFVYLSAILVKVKEFYAAGPGRG